MSNILGLELQRQVSGAMNTLRKELADIGGANTPEMKAAAAALRRAIKKQLSTRGTLKTPSKPGEPPRRERFFRGGKLIDSALWKSIGTEVVGGVMRVGSSYFTSRLLEGGVDASLHARLKVAASASRFAKHGRPNRRTLAPKRISRLEIAPRPFMQRAIDAAAPEMGEVFAAAVQKRIEGGGSANVR